MNLRHVQTLTIKLNQAKSNSTLKTETLANNKASSQRIHKQKLLVSLKSSSNKVSILKQHTLMNLLSIGHIPSHVRINHPSSINMNSKKKVALSNFQAYFFNNIYIFDP